MITSATIEKLHRLAYEIAEIGARAQSDKLDEGRELMSLASQIGYAADGLAESVARSRKN